MTIDFKFRWKHFQNIVKCLISLLFVRLGKFSKNLKARSHFTEIIKQAKLILVVPATNSTSERLFSLLKLDEPKQAQ